MRLLVSVRDASEAERAVAGGAAIVDAKEPARGSIGQVSAKTLVAIRRAVPDRTWMSAALGDLTSAADVTRACQAVSVPLNYVKLGFRDVPDAVAVAGVLACAVEQARRLPGRPAVIAVAYADHDRAASVAPEVLAGLLRGAGAAGLLIDTCFKDDGGLFRYLAPLEVAAIAARLAADQLTLALGGSLEASHVGLARAAGAQILGVRGAVCQGGRNGVLSEARVRRLARAIEPQASPIAG